MTEAPGWGARNLTVQTLGVVPYEEGLRLQEDLVERRRSGRIGDTLLLLEHPHVITRGSAADEAHILAGPEELEARGIDLYDAGRGGDVTYHGPGQLVGYPILDLKPDLKDLHAYLRRLEDVLIGAVARFGVVADRSDTGTGVWVGADKVAAIGIRVSSGWITSHGFALNANTDLSYFETIVPCGIREGAVTSLSRLLDRGVTPDAAAPAVVAAMVDVFGYGSTTDAGGSNSK